MKKYIAQLLSIVMLFGLIGVSVHAADSLIPISGVVLNDQLNFQLNSAPAVPVGDDGTPVLPISYNGTTYLPVRAIGYLLGLGIDYDGPSKTVLITSTTTKPAPSASASSKSLKLIPISNVVLNEQLRFKLDNAAVIPVGDDGTPVLPISYNGTTYLPVRAIGYLLGLGIGYDGPTKTVLITKGGSVASPQPMAKTQVWKLSSTEFFDATHRSESVLMGTTSKMYDLYSYEGTPNNLTITHNRFDDATGIFLAGVTYQSIWSNPPEYLYPGQFYEMNYQLITLNSKVWKPDQQTIYFNQGLSGVYFVSSTGVKYIAADINDVFTSEKKIEKGSKGATRTLRVTNGKGFSTLFTYEWVE